MCPARRRPLVDRRLLARRPVVAGTFVLFRPLPMWSPRTQGALGRADTFPELGAAAVTAALVPPLARGLAGDVVVGMMTEEQEFFIAEAEHALGPVTRREEVT